MSQLYVRNKSRFYNQSSIKVALDYLKAIFRVNTDLALNVFFLWKISYTINTMIVSTNSTRTTITTDDTREKDCGRLVSFTFKFCDKSVFRWAVLPQNFIGNCVRHSVFMHTLRGDFFFLSELFGIVQNHFSLSRRHNKHNFGRCIGLVIINNLQSYGMINVVFRF